jgi:hypothetical protein
MMRATRKILTVAKEKNEVHGRAMKMQGHACGGSHIARTWRLHTRQRAATRPSRPWACTESDGSR